MAKKPGPSAPAALHLASRRPKCLFTADNFFRQDQFGGSGGWMGMNPSFRLPDAASAQKVLDVAPEWVLAKHGGPFVFNAQDFKRRVQ